MNLDFLGWNDFFAKHFAPYGAHGYIPARVISEHKHLYRLQTDTHDLMAQIAGKLRYTSTGFQDFPAVGDWVAIAARPKEGTATIHALLPRKSKFSRKAAGKAMDEQVVAANMDTVFLVNALNHDFNPRRLERYLTIAWESGADPVIILSKADLCTDLSDKMAAVENIALGVPVHMISSVTGDGLTSLSPYLAKGRTVVLLGSSGAGKSTLLNALMEQEIQPVQAVRQGDDRGRHTTTHRQLFLLSQGGLIMDTPGMRELQLLDVKKGLTSAFQDLENLASCCRFRDCQHQGEPGCAIQTALAKGTLSPERLESYRKLQKELAYANRKGNLQASLAEKERWKKISQLQKEFYHKK